MPNDQAENSIDALGSEFFDSRLSDLKKRVKPKRLKHIKGVSKTAGKLARIYGVDVRKAKLAGLLHDWDKGYDDDGIRARISELGLESEIDPFIIENMPQVLHGPTAAKALQRDFPQIPDDVIIAIRDHTTSAVDADDLSKILYVSDAIEPSRNFDDIDDLREMVGNASLDELFFEVYKFWTLALLKRGRTLHPDTIGIWNSLVLDRKREDE